MKTIDEMTHKRRTVDILRIGERCNCPYQLDKVMVPIISSSVESEQRRIDRGETVLTEDAIGCRQYSFRNTKHDVAGTYGESVFLCDWCYQDHGTEVADWSKGRRDFIEEVAEKDPALLEMSMNSYYRHNKRP